MTQVSSTGQGRHRLNLVNALKNRYALAVIVLLMTATAGLIWGTGASAVASKTPSAPPALPAALDDSTPWRLLMPGMSSAPAPLGKTPDSQAEALLFAIYDQMRQGRREAALAQASRLVTLYPHFQLGQLVYADLLNIGLSRPLDVSGLAAADAGLAKEEGSGAVRLDKLLQESRQRLKGMEPAAPAGWQPRNFAALAPEQPYALAVDTSKSRLYWFANKGAASPGGVPRLELIMDTYVSVGREGVGKQAESDSRTPTGVYFIGKNLSDTKLPDIYGAGALTMNYPNALDLMRGKTGSGIWLHGTVSHQYSGPPQNSNGCVVLSNSDLKKLLALESIRGTPVVIAEKLEWAPSEKIGATGQSFSATLEKWQQAQHHDPANSLPPFYSARFQRDGKDLSHWWPDILSRATPGKRAPALQMLSMMHWVDQEEHMIVTLGSPEAGSQEKKARLRLYWAKEGGTWKIVYQGPVAAA